MNEKKIFGYFVLVGLVIYVLATGIFGDIIANFAYTQIGIVQLIFYYFTQTQFVIIFIGTIYIGILKKKILGGIGAGFLINFASDMVSTPRCVMSSGFIQNAPNLALCSDTVYIRWLDYILPHGLSYALYYYIIPVILIFIAFELVGITKFTKLIFPSLENK